MANLYHEIKITFGRDCIVDGRAGRLLAFTGLNGDADAIVEFAEGVEYVNPTKLQFTDEDHKELCDFQKYLDEKKENEK